MNTPEDGTLHDDLKALAEALTKERRAVVARWRRQDLDAEAAGAQVVELNKSIEAVRTAAEEERTSKGAYGING